LKMGSLTEVDRLALQGADEERSGGAQEYVGLLGGQPGVVHPNGHRVAVGDRFEEPPECRFPHPCGVGKPFPTASYFVGACAAGAAGSGEGIVKQRTAGRHGGGGAGHGGTMHGGLTCSGKFRQDLCGGMSWKWHSFLGGHFSAGGHAACGVAPCGLAHGSGAQRCVFLCQACASFDRPIVPIGAQRINVHRCGRIGISPSKVNRG
jgi:hypothetical protein